MAGTELTTVGQPQKQNFYTRLLREWVLVALWFSLGPLLVVLPYHAFKGSLFPDTAALAGCSGGTLPPRALRVGGTSHCWNGWAYVSTSFGLNPDTAEYARSRALVTQGRVVCTQQLTYVTLTKTPAVHVVVDYVDSTSLKRVCSIQDLGWEPIGDYFALLVGFALVAVLFNKAVESRRKKSPAAAGSPTGVRDGM